MLNYRISTSRNEYFLSLSTKKAVIVLDLSKNTKELSKLLFSSENILLICHINPDGDAIGSQLALYHYLKSKGKKVGMLSPNHLQEFLKWMDGADQINVFIKHRKKSKKLIEEADLIVMLDFNHSNRLGEAENSVLKSGAKKVIIDHHINWMNIADLIISDPSKCSTAELLHEIITGINNGPFISKSYAEAIYVGIITDTGNFVHGSYSGITFRLIGSLLDQGIEKDKIYNLIYQNFSSDRMRLQGFALNKRMLILAEYHTAYIFLTKKDLADYNYKKGDTEGFVNLPLSISGINFSTLLTEKDDYVKLSFRSKGTFSVNDFAARYFSGGGHLNAAGGEFYGTLKKAIDRLIIALNESACELEDKSK